MISSKLDRTIFKNNDVYESIPEHLFSSPPFNSCRSKHKDIWFSTPPNYTTVRVNKLVTTAEKVEAFINDSLIEQCGKREVAVPTVYIHSILQDCLVVTPWQLEGDGDLPRHTQEVIVDAACGAAVLRGANIFAPGVLGLLSYTIEEDLVSVYADSLGQCTRGLSVPFTNCGKVFVGNGVMKMSRKLLFQNDLHPKGMAVEMTHPASKVTAVSIPQNLGLLQNLPSIVCGHVVSPQPGDHVIDLCAAPGHKTTHLASLMANEGVLVALDKISSKVISLQSLCQLMHADCVKAFVFDSTKAVAFTPGLEWAPPYVPETFDHVLLDAPCSALGQRPQFGNKITQKQVSSYPKLQQKLFSTAVHLVKPGGTLVYSTCTLTIEENEDLVSWALDNFPQLDLVPALPFLGKPGYPQSQLSEAQCKKVQRFGPPLGCTPEDDTIGFFIAKFIKVG